jgi:hypothetical protein
LTPAEDSAVVQLTPESLDTYFRAGIPTTHLLSLQPRCELRIDPGADTYELLTPAVGLEPDVAGLQYVSVDTVETDDGRWFRLFVAARDLRYEAYGLVISVVQSMRGGATFAAATGAALTNLRSIISSRRRLSTDQQLGLIGELLVVRRLLDTTTETDVVGWWLGPLAEQHDFALPGFDVEVKTTTSERRTHLISGTGQLQPNPHRALWLVSIQLTRAGGAEGISLAQLVGDVRSRLTASRQGFLEHLVRLGWRDDDEDLYHDRFLLRSRPAAYPVDDEFPALTPGRLASAVPHPELVSAVSYRVDVSNWTPGNPGEPVDAFLASPEGDHD